MINVTRYSVRLVKEDCKRYELSKIIDSVDKAAEFVNEVFDMENLTNEIFVMVALDIKKKVIGAFKISEGTINMTAVSSRDVYQRALLANAHSIIVAHNHPSGDVNPSREDRTVTMNLKEAGMVMQIELNDSLIIGEDGKYYSFLEAERLWEVEKMKKYLEEIKNTNTLAELKATYKNWCMKLHPDLSGEDTLEDMKELNNAYEEHFKMLKTREMNKDKKDREKFSFNEAPEDLINIINTLIKFKGLQIDIVGNWIWLSGNTYPYKEEIKALKFHWSKAKKNGSGMAATR